MAVLAIHIVFVLGINIYTYFINKEIMVFEDSGKDLFERYSILNIVFLKYKESVIEQENFNLDRYSIYDERIKDMKKFKKVQVRMSGKNYY